MGTCSTCHNGTIATGKSSSHLTTTLECDACHQTTAWTPATFDHTGVTQPCSTCHNGTTATGKGSSHISSTNTCDACHSTVAWSPVTRIDHNNVLGSCSTCHDGITATGKSNGHFNTSVQCDSCHTTSNWNFTNYSHTGNYPGQHRGNLNCNDCHTSNNEIIPWRFPYSPDCAGCHANQFESRKHSNQSVSALRDCSGACHEKNHQHSVNDSGFGD